MRNQLEQAVIALAQSADVQLSLFPAFVCKVDELALNFEDGLYELVGHEDELTSAQYAAVQRLEILLTSMSSERNTALWTEDALRSHPTWEHVGFEAKDVVAAFGWEDRSPSGTGAVYIRGG